jgi:galactose mutarotase-like enzyme
MTKWISHGEAMTYARYANRSRVGEYALQSRRYVIRRVVGK